MSVSEEILSKLKISKGTSDGRAIQAVRDYLDSQPNPLKAANAIINKVGIKPIDNRKKAYVFAMTTVEQSLHTMTPDIETIIKKSNERIEKITDLLGPGAFIVHENSNDDAMSRKGPSKRSIAQEIYLQNKDKGEKYIIELVQKELEVTKQNAYTYIYLVKKDLKL